MIFAVPWAWLGLLAVPALAAIYFLRRKSSPRTVSSLLLWSVAPPRHEGGRRVERFEAPPLFWLELLVLLLLVLAAAGPHLPTPESRRPLVVVLDDSFSMAAGGEGSPLHTARAALLEELGSGLHLSATLIAAGVRPRLLGEGAIRTEQVRDRLDAWRALAPAAALEDAVSLGFEVGGPRARLLVLTDRAPGAEALEPRLVWRAFGRPRPNLAVVQAVRSAGERSGDGNVLLEVANFSDQPVTAALRVRVGEEGASRTRSLPLAAGSRGRVRFQAGTAETVVAELAGDALAFDDGVVLLPAPVRSTRVENAVRDPALRRLVDATLLATERARVVSAGAELVVSDRTDGTDREVWNLRLLGASGGKPFLGPFVLDLNHPLTEGLGLEGVVWTADETAGAPGFPVVSAGDVPLVLDRELEDGGHDVVVRFRHDLSTLQQTPNWPILWWNLLAWHASSAPGLRHTNVRLGETVRLTTERGVGGVLWRRPSGEERALAVSGGGLELLPEMPGVHELRSDRGTDRFAVNVLSPEESDLRRSVSGRWGGWEGPGTVTWGYRPLAWLAVLPALAGLLVHLRWTAGARRTPAPPLPRRQGLR